MKLKIIFLTGILIFFAGQLLSQQHTFTNVTNQMGISGQTGLGHSVGWCDIENDGDLDLAFSNQDGSGFWLYRNDGSTFTNINSSVNFQQAILPNHKASR